MPSLEPESSVQSVPAIRAEESLSSHPNHDQNVRRNGSNNFRATIANCPCSDNLDPRTDATTMATAAGTAAAPPAGLVPGTTALEQYRLQLYNYALHMERFRYAPHEQAPQQQHHQSQHQQQRQQHYIGNGGYTAAAAAAYMPSNRFALSMSLFPQHIFKPEDPKPQHSYIGLIAMAILSSTELKLVLSDIYQYILDNYPYFRTRGPGWRNSIRHNLSLNDCFVKSGRSANGKGHYWAIHPANMEDFRKGDFRRRKAQRKVRKHMGLSVDDAGTDSPSPPPLDLSSPPPQTLPLPPVGSAAAAAAAAAAVSQLHGQAHHLSVAAAAAQQLAAFSYLQQRQQPVNVFLPPVAGGDASNQHHHHIQQHPSHHYNFRPLAARYYVATAPASTSLASSFQRLNSGANTNLKTSTAVAAAAAATTASVIANLYTQSRKRQFDMASLLAPDVEVVAAHDTELGETTTRTTTTMTTLDVGEELLHSRPAISSNTVGGVRTTQLQHTVITKVTMNQCNHHVASATAPTTADADDQAVEEQNEDIDVVDIASIASDIGAQEDMEDNQESGQYGNFGEYDEQPDDEAAGGNIAEAIEKSSADCVCHIGPTASEKQDANVVVKSNSNSRQSPFDGSENPHSEYKAKTLFNNNCCITHQDSLPSIQKNQQSNSHGDVEGDADVDYTNGRSFMFNTSISGSSGNHNNHEDVDPYAFGRYYGSYMAAAARRLHTAEGP